MKIVYEKGGGKRATMKIITKMTIKRTFPTTTAIDLRQNNLLPTAKQRSATTNSNNSKTTQNCCEKNSNCRQRGTQLLFSRRDSHYTQSMNAKRQFVTIPYQQQKYTKYRHLLCQSGYKTESSRQSWYSDDANCKERRLILFSSAYN